MKVSTAFLFDRATERMATLQGRLANTQAQLSLGKQIISPSDAPDQAASIQRLRGAIERQQSHVATLNVALRRYSTEETALQASNDILIRVKELGVQAANDSLGAGDRQAIATEMKALRGQLQSLGNSQDDSGNYLFSGTRVKSPAFTEDFTGRVSYQGDQTQTRIPAGVERTVAYTRAGSDVFARVARADGQGGSASVGFFDALDDMIKAVNTNNTQAIQRGIGEVDQMQLSMSLAVAQTGSDQQIVLSQLDVLTETSVRLKSSLSEVEDLDYTEAVTRMNKEMTALESAMASFGKISSLSLFDYVGR